MPRIELRILWQPAMTERFASGPCGTMTGRAGGGGVGMPSPPASRRAPRSPFLLVGQSALTRSLQLAPHPFLLAALLAEEHLGVCLSVAGERSAHAPLAG